MKPIRLAIVHYHLRRGGVASIIARAIAALDEHAVSLVVLSGEAPDDTCTFASRVRVIDELAYSADNESGGGNSRELADRMEEEAQDALGGPADIWHIHNHALGKNPVVTRAVRCLADRGRALLLHIHDFVEDGRPANYRRLADALGDGDATALSRWLYPSAPHVHYALLNDRDVRILRAAGIRGDRVHLLPNPAASGDDIAPPPPPPPPGAERLFLYSTRAIRRKNLGEFLLWAAMAPPDGGDRFATTLAPRNPEQRRFYLPWAALAERLRLPVALAINEGRDAPLADLTGPAFALATTSIAEGFGLAFLEPWLLGRPVVGRNLPEVTGGLRDAGVDLSSLYDRLDVPVDWIGLDILRLHATTALEKYLAAYGRPCAGADVERAIAAWVRGDKVDFGRLDEPLQQQVIERVSGSPSAAGEIEPATLAASTPDVDRVAANHRVISREFGLQQYGHRMMDVYTALRAAGDGPVEDGPAVEVLEQFLDPARFMLLRTS